MEKGFLKNFVEKPEKIFLIFGLFFGILLALLTPIFDVPDEPYHLLRAIEVSHGVFYNSKSGDYRKDFLPNKKVFVLKEAKIFSKMKNPRNIGNSLEKDDLNYRVNNSGYAPLAYIPSAITLKIIHIFTENPYVAFFAGRLANLFVWLALIYLAIKITPILKYPFLFCALFPMSIHVGASLSGDSFNNAFAFLYVAFMFDLIYGKKEKLSGNQVGVWVIMTLMTVFLKGFIFLSLLFFLIPKEKLKNKNLIFVGTLLAAGILQVLFSASSYFYVRTGVSIEEQKSFILNNPFKFLCFVVKTNFLWDIFYMKSSICILEWLDVKPFRAFCYLIFGIFCMTPFFIKEKIVKVCKFDKIYSLGIISVYALFLFFTFFITFTQANEDRIMGVQGRYFIPFYPLFGLIIMPFAKENDEKKEKIFKIFLTGVIFASLVYTLWLVI